MKKSFLLLVTMLGFNFLIVAQSSSDDTVQVKKTIWNYLNGRNNGDSTLLKSAFHPKAELRFVNKDHLLTIWSIADYIKGTDPGHKQNCKSRIIYIDIFGTAAQAKVEIEYPNWIFIDYMNLLKIDNEWLIAVKTFAGKNIK